MSPAADKASDAFRTISEAAEELDLQQHVLRFWETRFTQIKPLKRGGGRRYYRPDDMDFLRGLKHLLHGERYTIKGVQKIIKDNGIKAVQTIWKEGGAAPVPTPVSQVAPKSASSVQPAPMPPAPLSAMAPLSVPHAGPGTARSHLQAALAELTECHRLIVQARAA
jgi:DNA-binding transcriptional MerR regulator